MKGARIESYVALFRGINVGGKNILPMKELGALLGDLGARNVGTYIQSGNAVFRSEETNASLLSDAIGAEVNERYDFTPEILLLSEEELSNAVAANPFSEAEPEPKTLHLFFWPA